MVSQRFAGNHATCNFDETNLDGEFNSGDAVAVFVTGRSSGLGTSTRSR
jgi:hypothetical protein